MRVLVIEDEIKMASLLKRGLEEEGLVVDIAHDGEEGLSFVRNHAYDLVLLDITLPLIDGLEVCRRMRAGGIATPVIMLTARDNVETKVSGLDSGADDYLTKPFAFAELMARIRALLRRNRNEISMNLQIGDLQLDPVTRRVTRGGQEIILTTKEYALLECFMRHPNQVLSRSMLSEKVWDDTFNTFTNIIDVYINYLRNKVDRDYEPKLIHTIRGVGYVMKPPG